MEGEKILTSREAVVQAYEEGGTHIPVHRLLLKDVLDQHAEGAEYVAASHAMAGRAGCWDGGKRGEDPCWACQFMSQERRRRL